MIGQRSIAVRDRNGVAFRTQNDIYFNDSCVRFV